MDRTILHVDANCFYASVECLYRPELRDNPMAVVGDVEKRHGIILTANYIAKRNYGIKTGEPLFQAKLKCPQLAAVKSNMPLYIKFSKRLKEILFRYSDLVESFGIDEAWVDVTDSRKLFGSGEEIAEQINRTVKEELGITVSIGVSFNKAFAKLGSDFKKPDGITVITKENFRRKVWGLPVSDLLNVGRRTAAKLISKNINTIGELANTSPSELKSWLGKNGLMLYDFANGYENSPVKAYNDDSRVKSISNSVTASRDLTTADDVKMIIYVLSDSIARRLREQNLFCKTVSVYIKTNRLTGFSRQCTLSEHTNLEKIISGTAVSLFFASCSLSVPIRAIGITVGDLTDKKGFIQLDIYGNAQKAEKTERLERAEDELKNRFGSNCIKRGLLIKDSKLTGFDPKITHTVHPVGYY